MPNINIIEGNEPVFNRPVEIDRVALEHLKVLDKKLIQNKPNKPINYSLSCENIIDFHINYKGKINCLDYYSKCKINEGFEILANCKLENGIIEGTKVYTSSSENIIPVCTEQGYIFLAELSDCNKLNLFPSYNTGIYYTTKALLEAENKDNYPEPISHRNRNVSSINTSTNIISENKKLTFGIEIETFGGYFPKYLYRDLDLMSVKDGSILDNDGKKAFPNGNYVGREFVTGVLYGDEGFRQVQTLCKRLHKRVNINPTCSVHVHIGNIKFTKEFIVYAFKLATMVQEDMFKMLPKSRRQNTYCKFIKSLDFTKLNLNLNKEEYDIVINDLYEVIFKRISGGIPISRNTNRLTNHPKGAKCGYDHSSARYDWLNFVPTIFDTRGNRIYTLEFRSHSASLNYLKIKNWILICMGFTNFVENRKQIILQENKITLSKLIEYSYSPKKALSLIKYIESRQNKFKNTLEDSEDKETKFTEEKESLANIIKI